MSTVELIVIVAEASVGDTVWSNKTAIRTEVWAALEGTGAQEEAVRRTQNHLLLDVPEGVEVKVFLYQETFQLDDEKEN